MRGRHVSRGSSRFLRDLGVMLLGILIVGVLVFGGMWAFTRGSERPSPTSSSTSTSGSVAAPTVSTVASSTTTVVSTTTTSTATTTSQATTTAVRDPSEITVLVLNAVGTPGVAGRLTDQLAAAGYQTLEPANYQPRLPQSRVWYREGFGAEAFEVAAWVPDALVELNEDTETDADIVIVLGASYQE